jgi:hypothetical protein
MSKDPRWASLDGWLDGLGEARPEQKAPLGLILRSEMMWATRDQEHWYVGPFEFEIELWPQNGELRSYTIRLADTRPVAAKEMPTSCVTKSDGQGQFDDNWLFVFGRHGKGIGKAKG